MAREKNRPHEYWRKRFAKLEQANYDRSIFYYSDLEKAYKQTMQRMDDDIMKWYNRFATANVVTIEEAKRILQAGELAEFKYTIEEYTKKAIESNVDGKWTKQLDNLLARKQVSRLESLQVQLQQSIELLYGGEVAGTERLIKEQYADQYYRSLYTVQTGFNVGIAFDKLDDRLLSKIISKPWTSDGLTFSQKIWRDRDRLIDVLYTELVQGAALGEGPERIVKAIREKLGTDNKIYEVRRIVTTESSFFSAAAQKDVFGELGVEKYEYLATLDSRTSKICQTFDGRVFDVKDFQPGVTANPLHPFCRSTTVPYFEDDDESLRFARDADGKGIYIPSNIKYADWEKRFGR